MRYKTWLLITLAFAFGCTSVSSGEKQKKEPAEVSCPTLQATVPVGNPPEWALLERQLIDAMSHAVEPLLEKYVREDGTILWPTREDFKSIDGLDDAYESFHNWPLFYLAGGHEKFLRYSHKEFDAITRQFAQYGTGNGYPMIVREYQPGYDWFHQGEGNYLFYMLCLADPHNEKSIGRARKFAGFFLNEDPDALNYDPEHKIIRCAHNGSKGSAFWNFEGDRIWTAWGYGLPFYDVPGVETVDDLKDPEKMKRFAHVCHERRGKGDAVANLACTSLVTNAYLMTGDAKYRDWVVEYVDAWIERTERNDGIVPDNVGLNGKIGKHMGGRWYGANYGWTWPHGWKSFGQAVVAAAENATLITKDLKYVAFPRSQMDVLISHGIEKKGKLYVPLKHGTPGKVKFKPWHWLPVLRNDDGKKRKRGMSPREYIGTALEKDGWFHFAPVHPFFMAHIWNTSMNAEDMKRQQKLSHRKGKQSLSIGAWHHTKDKGGHDGGWLDYMRGEYPDYPVEILRHNLKQVYGRLAFMQRDKKDPSKYGDSYIQKRNPVTMEGLVQLTMGGPLPVYNGGLLMVRLRYFDPVRRRPGLPPGVAALVSKLSQKRTVVRILNLHPSESRRLMVQAGGFGEHDFGEVTYTRQKGRRRKKAKGKIGGNLFQLNLPPATRIELELETRRFVNRPSCALPWAE
ncbi:MAG: hypothetical protein ACLFWL_02710 [Candidatus Brocadiia bacterium]